MELKRILYRVPCCLAKLSKISSGGFSAFRVENFFRLQNPRMRVLQTIKDPFPRVLLYVRTPPPPLRIRDTTHDSIAFARQLVLRDDRILLVNHLIFLFRLFTSSFSAAMSLSSLDSGREDC